MSALQHQFKLDHASVRALGERDALSRLLVESFLFDMEVFNGPPESKELLRLSWRLLVQGLKLYGTVSAIPLSELTWEDW